MLSTLPSTLLALLVVSALDIDTRSYAQVMGTPDDYAPQTNVACPNVTQTPLLRVFTPETQSLNALEANYVSNRQQTTIVDAWKDWLDDGSKLGYSLSDFDGLFPKVGIGLSGGGYRAAQYGAGVLSGLDSRNDSAKAAGAGGLLQVASYISALSGGSWVTGSLMFNDFPTVHDVVFGNSQNLEGWLLDFDLATPDGINLFSDDNQYFFGSVLWSVLAKARKGIDTSLTDPWARMISYHFLNHTSRRNFFTNETGHGAGQLWSRLPDVPSFQQALLPFPIVVANSRPVGSKLTTVLSPEPVVYEITPAEFGSWDPNLSAMMNTTYAGTHLDNGNPPNSTGCVTGFDQVGFVMGTSASLFNQILDFAQNKLGGFDNNDASGLLHVLGRQLSQVRTRADDVANWPSPFHNVRPETFEDSSATWIELIDGSSNLENIPLGSLFVNVRELDVIVAVDSSADTPTRWPNGTSILFTQQRLSRLLQSTHQQFPPIPASSSDFVETGTSSRPTFFGCDPKQNPPEYPLVIYLPNSPPFDGTDPVTNTGTFKLFYAPEHTSLFIDQAHGNTISGFTAFSNVADAKFGSCLQCAAIDRARYALALAQNATIPLLRSDICRACFKQYCYDPADPPSRDVLTGRKEEFVDPDPRGLARVEGFLGRARVGLIVGCVMLVAAMIGIAFAIRYWKKRKDRAYKRITQMYEDADAPWKAYSGPLAGYELPDSGKKSQF